MKFLSARTTLLRYLNLSLFHLVIILAFAVTCRWKTPSFFSADIVGDSPFSFEITFDQHCMTQMMGISPKDLGPLDFLRKASASISFKPRYAHGIAEALLRTANVSMPLKKGAWNTALH